MKIGKRVLSAVTAGFCAFSLFSGTAPLTLSAFAADDEQTFDERPLDDIVDSRLFEINCNDIDVVDNLKSVIESACGEEIDNITYRHLQKITSLDLSEMELTDVPLCIKYMENLRSLDLSFNNLQYADNVKTLDLSALKRLNYLDVSFNYLNRVPSWFVLDGIDNKYIDGNLLAGDDQRSIKAQTPVYYFMDGEDFDADDFQKKILADICFDDGSALPDFLYNPDDYPAEQPLHIVLDSNSEFPLDAYVNENGEINLDGADYVPVTIKVQLFNNASNANTITEIKVFLLDGSSPTTAKARLETLLGEVENLDKTFYTERSWTNFENAQKTAQAIFDYSNSTAEMLKTALEQLAVAHNSLVLGVDTDTKGVLTELTSVGKTYKEEDYTPSSWNSLQKSLDKIAEISADKNATLSTAKSAILSFQNAQKGLEKTRLSVPSVIPKSSFETIFGESNKSISTKGTTRGGRTYEWKFTGTSLTAPADFNPEISDTPTGEDAIMLESGRAGGYLAFSTAQSGAFAGTGTLTMNVSDKFGDGTYYYYRWNSSGSLIGEVSVKDGKLSVDVSEGGTYYVCNVLQKFELVADKLEIDAAKRSVVVPLCTGYNAASFKKLFKYGSSVSVYDLDGKPVSSSARIKTGMKVSAPKGEEYAITVMGDVNDDGYVNGADAFAVLKNFVLEDDEKFGIGVTGINIADVNGDGFMNAKDSMLILKAFVG